MLPAFMFPRYSGYAGYVGVVLHKEARKGHDRQYPDNPLILLDFEDGKDSFWLKVPTWDSFKGDPRRVLTHPDVVVMRLGRPLKLLKMSLLPCTFEPCKLDWKKRYSPSRGSVHNFGYLHHVLVCTERYFSRHGRRCL